MTVAAHGGDIYQNQITYDFSVNTNPLPLPEILQKRMAEAAVHSNRYPQYDNVLLRERLAVLYGFSTEEVVCGNGASELFVAIVHALRPKRVGILAPSFSGYAWAAQTVGAEICSIPLREENNFAMDMAQMESLCRQQVRSWMQSRIWMKHPRVLRPRHRVCWMRCQRSRFK